jgi:hypothetical protein
MRNSSAAEIFRMFNSGQLQFNLYNTSTAFSSGLTSVGVLNVDNTGKVFVGAGTYTVNNGLTESPANNFQLGGTLIQNTTIAANTFDIIFTGTKLSKNAYVQTIQNTLGGSGLRISVTGLSHAARFTADTGEGIIAESNTGDAVYALANTTGTALLAESTSGRAIEALSLLSNTISLTGGSSSAINEILKLLKTNVTGAVGGGLSIDFEMLNASNTLVATGRIAFVFNNATGGNESTDLEIRIRQNGSIQKVATFKSTGQLILDKYGQTPANFPGTPVWSLGVDASGNVVEFTASPTTGDSVSPFLLMGG